MWGLKILGFRAILNPKPCDVLAQPAQAKDLRQLGLDSEPAFE